MLTKKQQDWLSHLSNDSKIKIIPFDPNCQEKFEEVKLLIQSKLGKKTEVKHCGASSLGISGQDEIDVYIPVLPNDFNNNLILLKDFFGDPRSCYSLERARFVTEMQEKHIDVFLINNKCSSWLDSLKFEKYLRENIKTLKDYEKLKESGHGVGVRDYYRKKIEFINNILERVN